ncbi:MAG: lysine--tRNA ligase, partial [Mesorhizobium sp.]|nr:lysine--tRNA ligase [Mesorhizobium sp.]
MAGTGILDLNPELLSAAAESKAWPFEEAKKIIARYAKSGLPDTVLFETGYGPSGLPHIGTFGEVARTTMVRHAFRILTQDKVKTRLLCFSDDMDGMRKIPDNVPDKAFLEPYLHMPLTSVPNPFGGDYESFGHHNNAMLRRFLDTFGFDYEFASATDYYKSGRFDDVLLRAAERYDAIMKVMLPTLGEERQATYSPFLPISPKTGRVLYVPMKHVDAKAGTITFNDEDGTETTLAVTGGKVKMQWKPDFGMRWAALGVDFEMFGKDHQTNAPIYDRICEILGGRAPEHFVYELFLDENGQKISKSKGNGLTIDEWLTYAPTESLGLYMYQKPRVAKKLYFDVIPRAVEEYYTFLSAYPRQDWKNRLGNPVWHMHSGNPPAIDLAVPFSLLLNLVSASNAQNKDVLWGFISRYAPGVSPEKNPELDRLTGYAIRYFEDFVKPSKVYRAPDDV